MAGPAKSGVFVYAKDVDALSTFYVEVLNMQQVHATAEMRVLNTADLQVVIHKMPSEAGASADISVPPAVRDSAIKPFIGVDSIAAARTKAKLLGGDVYPQEWQGPGFNVCNAVDPEGNVFQVREPND